MAERLVRRSWPLYMYLGVVKFVASLPKTETGKIRRVELRKKEMEVFQQISG
ncbi:MAG: hypothetical protein HY649_01990 [Acidobacteria bacterium]|nr:hypothetical protein [Acidobacteriota bacterium]